MTEVARRPLLITGGTGGLGRAVVQRLLAEYPCIVLYRSAKDWQALQAQLQHEHLYGVEADLADETAVGQAVERARAEHGPLYGLVHLAGGFEGGSVAETSLETWHKLLTTNLTSAFTAIRAVLPQLQERGAGRIIAIGSAEVAKRTPGLAAYTVSKAGLNVLIEVLAREVQNQRITANILLPGSLDTPTMQQFVSRDKLVPLDRVAETIAFLLSDAAASITGASIPLPITGAA